MGCANARVTTGTYSQSRIMAGAAWRLHRVRIMGHIPKRTQPGACAPGPAAQVICLAPRNVNPRNYTTRPARSLLLLFFRVFFNTHTVHACKKILSCRCLFLLPLLLFAFIAVWSGKRARACESNNEGIERTGYLTKSTLRNCQRQCKSKSSCRVCNPA